MARGRDRGSTTAETVIVFPVVMSIMLLGFQAVTYFHSAHIASSAASQGASAAAGTGSRDGVRVATDFARDAGANLASSPVVFDDGWSVRVAVELRVPAIVPFFPTSVRREADEPKERFVNEADRSEGA